MPLDYFFCFFVGAICQAGDDLGASFFAAPPAVEIPLLRVVSKVNARVPAAKGAFYVHPAATLLLAATG
jgi:hypothetical protein